jgi:hypothetical protein
MSLFIYAGIADLKNFNALVNRIKSTCKQICWLETTVLCG